MTEWTNRDKAWLDVTRGLRLALGELGGVSRVVPRYADEESRRLSLRLKDLFRRRKDLTIADDDTREIRARSATSVAAPRPAPDCDLEIR